MDAASQRRWARLATVRVRAQRRVQRRFAAFRSGRCAHDLWVESMELVLYLDALQKRGCDGLRLS